MEAPEKASPTSEESAETPEPEVSEEEDPTSEESAETPEPEVSEEADPTSEESAEMLEPEVTEEAAPTPEEPAETPEMEAPEKASPTPDESAEELGMEALGEATPVPEESVETSEKVTPTSEESTEMPEPEAPEEAAPTSEESAETSEPEASEETASAPEESVKTPNSEESKEAVSATEEAPKSQETEIPQEPAVSEEQDPWEKIPAAVQEIPMEIDLQPEPEEAPAKDFEPDPWEEVPAGKAESISDEANSPAEVTDEVTEKSAGENSEEDPWADIPEGTEKEKSSAALETTPYQRPPASLLEYSAQQDDAQMQEELQTNGDHLIDTLKSFGVQATMLDISRGPAVTRYELQPAAGVKISKITNLADDIAMNLAAPGVRIEAPIPGKAAVGIEVPNKKVNTVRMRELVESKEFLEAESPLTVALGRDIAGKITLANLAKMPHLLIAGSTGSGKSVCINSLIVSLLYKSSPDQVRFLMIDPKVVELGIYNGIPQLLVPVVTDPRKAAGALNWAVSEMLKRYQLFADNSVRDLGAYNRLAKENGYQDDDGQPMPALPQIVIIIDELADLMMAAPNDVENAICRLAQMARAAGMHLVIATQRPSVDVITGIIKANIPSRIAFAVSSQIDSRTILDMGGAEKLLGRGDMLFSPMGVQKPMRVQGCFVSDGEIESVVKFVKGTQDALYDSTILDEIERSAVQENEKSTDDDSSGGDMDPMLQDAIKCVAEAGQASASLLQRRLRLGYARAGRLIDEMEDMGIIGPREGSKPRQVLITYQQYLEMSVNREE
ncbi:MAG TPA: DNA translocase FtsK [Candidatus Gallacutalibacter pullicola]|uniref:DNA translocase FtsK n=1 Tax=Candidatus Gallacutalibacter pullicola TaxID=2840830 RepID=A0A9D1DSW4_9FIRM|nr:DNA translocase FtsK [Candidatus Gallacutalibacter pullicola]